jgi:hypothetical protein
MKTINKFSIALLLAAVVGLCSYAMMSKRNIDESNVAKTNTIRALALVSDSGTERNIETTIRKASCACGQLKVTTNGPDPERRSLCHCHLCQKQTGSWFGVQARFPREQVTIEGKSKEWKYPAKEGKTVTGRTCGDGGVTYHFCPNCGSTVYYIVDTAKDYIGIKVGAFVDPTFPAPNIAGFEEYKFPWAMNLSGLQMEHHN